MRSAPDKNDGGTPWERDDAEARKPWIVPIPGTTKRHRLEENIGAAAVELTADDLRAIDGALSDITVQGDRYPLHLAARIDR